MPRWLFDLTDRVAIVTGAARGLGRRLAEGLAAQGARVVACDINAEGSRDTAAAIAKLNGQATGIVVEVADPSSCAALVRQATGQFGAVDVLVNNAAVDVIEPVARDLGGRLGPRARGGPIGRAARVAGGGPPDALPGAWGIDHQHFIDRVHRRHPRTRLVQRGERRGEPAHQGHGGRAGTAWHPSQRGGTRLPRERHAGGRSGARRIRKPSAGSGPALLWAGVPGSTSWSARWCSWPPRLPPM